MGGAAARRPGLSWLRLRARLRHPAGRDRFPAGTEILHADLLSREAVVEAARGADVVVHAANVPYPEWPKLVPVLAENALAAAEAAGAILAFPGNVYVYGHPRSRPVREDHPQEPNTQKGKLRLRVEQMILQAHRDGRVRVVLPRYPDVYGPGIMHAILQPISEGTVRGQPCRWPLDADAPHEFILTDAAAHALLKLV